MNRRATRLHFGSAENSSFGTEARRRSRVLPGRRRRALPQARAPALARFDLFHAEAFDPDEVLRELEAAGITAGAARSKPNSLLIEVGGIRTSFRHFPYPLIAASDDRFRLPIASLQDLAAMKMESIASRGARKDFTDLYFILQSGRLTLNDALQAFHVKFGVRRPDLLHR